MAAPERDDEITFSEPERDSPPAPTNSYLGIVGYCRRCGNPIYGLRFLAVDRKPDIRRSCNCTPYSH